MCPFCLAAAAVVAVKAAMAGGASAAVVSKIVQRGKLKRLSAELKRKEKVQ
ncbi:MAG TPA: hypothetical protein VLV88_14970 [Terriglobales bacterium]|nr:hypothetical protein [Candidatus Acidoferrum sp.]HUL17298.1 hypothetical protein [Terriglobales bacterium]